MRPKNERASRIYGGLLLKADSAANIATRLKCSVGMVRQVIHGARRSKNHQIEDEIARVLGEKREALFGSGEATGA